MANLARSLPVKLLPKWPQSASLQSNFSKICHSFCLPPPLFSKWRWLTSLSTPSPYASDITTDSLSLLIRHNIYILEYLYIFKNRERIVIFKEYNYFRFILINYVSYGREWRSQHTDVTGRTINNVKIVWQWSLSASFSAGCSPCIFWWTEWSTFQYPLQGRYASKATDNDSVAIGS